MQLYFRQPHSLDYQEAGHVAEIEMRRLIKQKVPTKAEIRAMLDSRGLFTIDHRQKVELLRKQLGNFFPKRHLKLNIDEDEFIDMTLLEILSGIQLVDVDKELFEEKVEYSETVKPLFNEFQSLQRILRDHEVVSLEERVNDCRLRALMSRCTYVFDTRQLVWGDYRALGEEHDVALFREYYKLFLQMISGYSQSVIRLIVRSTSWYLRWMSAKETSCPLFPNPITDWNVNQISLSYWSMYYDNLRQESDAPKNELLKDDQAVDRWVKQKQDERERDRVKQASGALNQNQDHLGSPSKTTSFKFGGR